MKKLLLASTFLLPVLALAQDITDHAVPVGGGPAAVGWRAVGPCAVGETLVWAAGPTADPTCGSSGGGGGISFTNVPPISVSLVGGSYQVVLATPLLPTFGGTGITSPTANRLLITAGASAMSVSNAGASGQVLVGTGVAPAFANVSGAITIDNTGATTISPSLINIYPGTSTQNILVGIPNTNITGAGGNAALGINALSAAQATAQFNTVIGSTAGQAITTGSNNTLLGYGSGRGITNSSSNVAIGWLAFTGIPIGTNNNNVVIGAQAATDCTACANNTIIGSLAGDGLTTGDNNTVIGANVKLSPSTAGTIAIGDGLGNIRILVGDTGQVAFPAMGSPGVVSCLQMSPSGTISTTGAACGSGGGGGGAGFTTPPTGNMFGPSAGTAAPSGDQNTAVGTNALGAVTTGASNVAYGSNALAALTTSTSNVAIGYQAGASQVGPASKSHNVFIGNQAAFSAINAVGNIAIGSGAAYRLIGQSDIPDATALVGNNNAFVGYQSGYGCTTCRYNVGVGLFTLQWIAGPLLGQDTELAIENTALGATAALSVTTGSYNTAVGANALGGDYAESIPGRNTRGITTGGNTAVGRWAMLWSHTPANNTALGHAALMGIGCVHPPGGDCGPPSLTGAHNVALGYSAMTNASLAVSRNTAVGTYALGGVIGPSAEAPKAMMVGTDNIAIGYASGTTLAGSASRNIVIGYCQDIQGGKGATPCPGIVSGNNNVVIGGNITSLSPTLTDTIVIATGNGLIRSTWDNTGILTLHTYAGVGTRFLSVSPTGVVGSAASLGVASGGTGLTSGISGGIPCYTGATTMASSALLPANGILYGGGAGVCPAGTAAGTAGQVLIAGTPPAFRTLSGAVGSVSGTGAVTMATSVVFGNITIDGTIGEIHIRPSSEAAPGLYLRKNDVTPTAGDTAGVIYFNALNSSGVEFIYGSIYTESDVITAGAEVGKLFLGVKPSSGIIAYQVALTPSSFEPTVDNTVALGAPTLGWSGIHLNSGAPINWENGAVTFSATGTTATAALTNLYLTKTSDTTSGPNILLYHNRATPVNGDRISLVAFDSNTSTSTDQTFASIAVTSTDVTHATRTGVFELNTSSNGSLPLNRFRINEDGSVGFRHKVRAGITGAPVSAPILSACGTSPPAVNGTDFAGTFTTGSSATTSCTLGFVLAYAAAPYCTVTPHAANTGVFITPGTASLVINYASATSLTFSYHCIARAAG